MADARPTFPLPQRYTQRKTEAVQPPDDRTYSAEVTGFRRNLLHHRSARAVFPYTRSIMIPPFPPFVKHIFRNNHKICKEFSSIFPVSFCSFPKRKREGQGPPVLFFRAPVGEALEPPVTGCDIATRLRGMRVLRRPFDFAQGCSGRRKGLAGLFFCMSF